MWKLNNTGIAYTKKHKNHIIDIWNKDSKCIYKESIENENLMKNIATYGNKHFSIVLREHFDSIIHIEEKVIPMEYLEITQAELHKHLKNIKKNKATGPDDDKGELYRALGRSEMCVGKLQTTLQNIKDNDLKIKSCEKSYTKLIPKVKKPTAKQMRPIALTDVSYKLFMTIIGKKIDRHVLENNKRMFLF